MKLYISGPITGNPHYEDDFETAEYKLREAGYQVFNPAAVPLPERESDRSWAAYMRRDLSLIMRRDADGIALLPGWADSKGSNLEVQIAKIYKIPVKPLQAWLSVGTDRKIETLIEPTRVPWPEHVREFLTETESGNDGLGNPAGSPADHTTYTPSTTCNHFWLSTETRDGIQQECVDCGAVNLERNPT